MTAPYQPIEIDPHDRILLEKIGRLRVLAWSTVMPDATKRTQCWLDEFELAARHWCIFHEGEPVAAARMSIHQRIEDVPDAEVYVGVFTKPLAPLIASINRLVTHPQFRGRGLSRELDEVRLKVAIRLGCRSVIGETHAGASRLRQLRDLGFQVIGAARPYRHHHFLDESGVVFYCDLAKESGILHTANRNR